MVLKAATSKQKCGTNRPGGDITEWAIPLPSPQADVLCCIHRAGVGLELWGVSAWKVTSATQDLRMLNSNCKKQGW